MYFSYDEYIYTIGDYLVDLLLLTSVIVFFSVVIKKFLSCLQISGSGEQEERILNLQNDLKTSIMVSSDSKTLKTDVSLIFISIKFVG